MASTATITFTGLTINVDDTLIVTLSSPSGNIIMLETFKSLRSANFQVTLADVGVPVENGYAVNYTDAWNLDYSQSGFANNLVAVSVGNTCIITLLDNSWQFVSVTGTTITGGKATAIISNDPVEDPKSTSVDSYNKNIANPCDNCDVSIIATGGNDLYNIYEAGVLLASSQSSPFTITFPRDYKTSLQILDTLGVKIGVLTVVTPRKLITSDISTSVLNLTSGGTLTITVPFISDSISPYTYSLDNVTYQTSNVFTGLSASTYTVYVKDAFDCVTQSSDIVIDGVTTVTQTNFSVSNINAIRYFISDSEKKNQKNTISCNELRLLSYPFYQKFLSTDTPTTQFKTNAQYINCYSIDSSGNKNTQIHVQRSQNTGLKAKSTSTYFDLGDGKSGIYFGIVNTLDYDTDAVIEETNYGFLLPEWANKEGNYVTIEGIGEVPIDSIGYSDNYESFILEFNIAYTGSPVERKISALYNLNPYEVYEFTTTMSGEPDSFNLVIEVGTSSDNIEFTYISEKIKRVEDSEFLFRIDYWDVENKGGMVYQTGIQHRLRLDGYVDYAGEQSTEGYNGDTQYFVTDNTVYDSQVFKFNRLSSEMAHKMRLVVAHSELYINGLPYKLSEEPELTGNSNFNLKTFSVTLKQSGDQFLTDAQESITNIPSNEAIAGAIEASQGKAMILHTKS